MDQGNPVIGEDGKFKLLADLPSQSAKDSAAVTNALIDSLQYQNDQFRATLNLIIDEVERMCSGDLMYSPAAIMRALYPRAEDIEELVNEYRLSRGHG